MERPLYTCRVTALETFRLFLHGQTERNEGFNTEANLIDTVKGIHRAGDKADFGTLGHAIIENRKDNRKWMADIGRWGYDLNGYKITTDQAMPILDYIQQYPRMVREITLSKLYKARYFDLIVTGHADGLNGIVCHDNKFKFSPYEVSDYIDSMQWKLYLDMLKMKHFQYDMFRVHGFEVKANSLKARIDPCESFLLHAYEGMERDIQVLIEEFSEWAIYRKLESFLEINEDKYNTIMASEMPIYQP